MRPSKATPGVFWLSLAPAASAADVTNPVEVMALKLVKSGDDVSLGTSSVSFDAVASRAYYIVTDGYLGSVAMYTLSMSCP